MKTLQNNFTTPEQSRRLLELGLPADSADCYYEYHETTPKCVPQGLTYRTWLESDEIINEDYLDEYPPCWSVGRLIEIYGLCDTVEWHYGSITINTRVHNDIIDYLMTRFDLAVNMREMDFSKLKE